MISLPIDVLQQEIDGNLEGSYRSEILKLYLSEGTRISVHFDVLGAKYRLHKPGTMTEFSHRSLPIISRWLIESGYLGNVATENHVHHGQLVANNVQEILAYLEEANTTT